MPGKRVLRPHTGITYDPNGNLLTLKRHRETGSVIDNLSYVYDAGTNRLGHADDAVGATSETWDVEDGGTNAFVGACPREGGECLGQRDEDESEHGLRSSRQLRHTAVLWGGRPSHSKSACMRAVAFLRIAVRTGRRVVRRAYRPHGARGAPQRRMGRSGAVAPLWQALCREEAVHRSPLPLTSL